jgi:hypothetical protein
MHSTISPRATRDRLIKDISGHCPGTHGLGGRARKKIVTRPKSSGISSMRSTTVDDVHAQTSVTNINHGS